MKKRILIIITILILVVLGIIGSIYFLSYKNDIQAKIESSNEINTLPENTINSIADDKNTVVNEMENNTVEENTETIITGISNETIETIEKENDVKEFKIEKAINNAIHTSWNKDKEKIISIFKSNIYRSKAPSARVFITTIADDIANQEHNIM